MADTSAPPAPPVSAAPPRRALFRHPGRVAVVAVVVLVVLNLGFLLLNQSDTTPGGGRGLPVDVLSVSPEPGQITGLVDTVSAQLATRYSGVLVIDGVEIPEDQLVRDLGLNTIQFRPGPDKSISRFRAGVNTVVVRYWDGTVANRPERIPYSYSWTFRASA